MIIELKGVEFDNKGSALMLHSILAVLRTRYPNIEFALSANIKSPASARHQVARYRKVTLRKLYIDLNKLTYHVPRFVSRFLKKRGVVLEGQVDAIIDASGFAYSDQWSPYMSLYHLAGEIERCHTADKPYIFLPQAFGPFSEARCQALLAKSLAKAALVCARDSASYQHLQKISGDFPQLIQAKDFTNSLKPTSYSWPQGFTGAVDLPRACIVVNVNMTTAKNKDKGWLARYNDMLVHCIEVYRAQGLFPFFLNHEGAGDASMITSLNATLGEPLPVIAPTDAMTVKQVIASSHAVLSSRFHGCVSALSSGIPCLGTSWSHKYEALYEDYQVPHLLLSPELTDTELADIIKQSLAPTLCKKVAERADELLAETDTLWQKVYGILDPINGHNNVEPSA